MNPSCTCSCTTAGHHVSKATHADKAAHAAEFPDAVEFLKQEHRVIERVLDAMEHELILRGPTPAFLWPALEFLAAFADGCHHHKEEEQLFPLLEARGVPREGGPIGVMLSEHDRGRALMKCMRSCLVAIEAGDAEARDGFRAAAAEYMEHLRQHIAKEDNVLFAMAARVMSAAERAQMASRFYDFERGGGRQGTHDRFVALADVLHRRAFGESRKAACC